MANYTCGRRDLLRAAGLGAATLAMGKFSTGASSGGQKKPPNIVYILADDMGYGDVSCLNPESKIHTPNIDRLANEGIKFTDAHSGAAVCTPTRYGVLTGRYCWRTRLKRGVLHGYDRHLIDKERMTVASLLKQHGYNTAGFGKWHLGMDFPTTDGKKPGPKNTDWKGTIKNGPNSFGFDYFYGISASLDMHPYIYIENDKFVGECTTQKAFHRRGLAHADFEAVDVLPEISRKTVEYIKKQDAETPFLAYVALTSPHTPIVPAKEYRGRSDMKGKAGEYADFCIQTDAVVGEITAALEEKGLAENTLVIYTSDNGFAHYVGNEKLESKGHYPSYIYRGYKSDAWDGGHRIPFIARWPGKVAPSGECDQTVCLTDLLATCAAIVNAELPADAGEDSYNILPALLGEKVKSPIREATVHTSIKGVHAIRQGKWKLIFARGSGGWTSGKVSTPGQLYDMEKDPDESENLYDKRPDVVKRLTALMEKYKRRGRSVSR